MIMWWRKKISQGGKKVAYLGKMSKAKIFQKKVKKGIDNRGSI